jgi:hypothetical protein
VNVNWDKLQTISNSILSTITTATANATTTTDGGELEKPHSKVLN